MVQLEQVLSSDLFVGLDKASPVPLWFQVSRILQDAIRDGHLPPGARLENEINLAQRLGLSRPTMRRAIQELVDKGLVVRRRGIGTQVVHGQVTRNVELTSLYEDLDGSNQRPTTKVLTHEVVGADEVVAERLGVPKGSSVLHLVRVRYADSSPLAVMDNTLPVEFLDFTVEALESLGLYQLMRTRGTTMRVAKQRISARLATALEREHLELKRGAAVLAMERTAFDASGRAVEFGHHCYSPELYSFEITLVD